MPMNTDKQAELMNTDRLTMLINAIDLFLSAKSAIIAS